MSDICAVPHCLRPVRCVGLCQSHYNRKWHVWKKEKRVTTLTELESFVPRTINRTHGSPRKGFTYESHETIPDIPGLEGARLRSYTTEDGTLVQGAGEGPRGPQRPVGPEYTKMTPFNAADYFVDDPDSQALEEFIKSFDEPANKVEKHSRRQKLHIAIEVAIQMIADWNRELQEME